MSHTCEMNFRLELNLAVSDKITFHEVYSNFTNFIYSKEKDSNLME